MEVEHPNNYDLTSQLVIRECFNPKFIHNLIIRSHIM